MQSRPALSRSRNQVDRATTLRIVAFVAAILVLVLLVGFLTVLPIQTITATVSQQASEQQRLLTESLARQMESYFNNLANDLVGLAGRPDVQSSARAARDNALAMLKETADRRAGQIVSIVRIGRDGAPLYAYPEARNEQIQNGESLSWTVDEAWVTNVIANRSVQFLRRPTGGSTAYLLAFPLTFGLNTTDVLVFEINLIEHLQTVFGTLTDEQLAQSGQIWVFDTTSVQIYKHRPQPDFSGGFGAIAITAQTQTITGYPTSDRESVVSPVYLAFTQNRSRAGSLVIILSRSLAEAQQVVSGTLQSLGLFSAGLIAFLLLVALLVGRFTLSEVNRRRTEESRRATSLTLLQVSRTLNSSLDIKVVLQKILSELRVLLPHDSASILLLNEDNDAVSIAAEEGAYTPDNQRTMIPLKEVRGAREVLSAEKPVVINDCENDPRWVPVPGSNIQSWLGVPLRIREKPVGVLNINSHEPNRFSPEDIEVAVAFADQAGVAIQNARAHELEVQVYEQELQTASLIQTSLLPQDAPPVPQLDVAFRTIPARQVSGDYYQYFVLPDNKLGIAVGDVSGKGIPAALMMAVVTTAMRDEILRTPSPAALLTSLNERVLVRMRQNQMNSALVVAVFDARTRHVEVANAGMLQPYVRNGTTWSEVPVGGYPIGASEFVAYKAKKVTLAPEAMMLFVTDGVIEAFSPAGELYGFDRLEALLNGLPQTATADDVVQAVWNSVKLFMGGENAIPADDVTIVAMRSLEI
jgi:serine phosphatase RsbU (regulator of sigma subunit)